MIMILIKIAFFNYIVLPINGLAECEVTVTVQIADAQQNYQKSRKFLNNQYYILYPFQCNILKFKMKLLTKAKEIHKIIWFNSTSTTNNLQIIGRNHHFFLVFFKYIKELCQFSFTLIISAEFF